MRGLGLVLFLALGIAHITEATAAGAPAPASTSELAGLWKAKRWFGPDARGPLTIRKSGATYIASMVGQDVPVKVAKGELSFELPKGQGSFRGRFHAGGEVLGHWYPPRGQAMGGLFTTVRLKPQGTHRWNGEVWDPLESTCRHASLSIL